MWWEHKAGLELKYQQKNMRKGVMQKKMTQNVEQNIFVDKTFIRTYLTTFTTYPRNGKFALERKIIRQNFGHVSQNLQRTE